LIDNTVTSASPERPTISLSDWAFMGHSFEARRWLADGLKLVGFDERLPVADGYAMGLAAEQTQYNFLYKNQPHPLNSPAPPPYSIQVAVGNQIRVPLQIGGDLYVNLEPGENFLIRLLNDDTRPVLCALYIDGVNTIGMQFQHPLLNP